MSADGTVYPLYSQQSAANFSAMDHSSAISTINYEVNRDAAAGTYPYSTHYYHGDQIGSARLMTSGQGWPIWQGTFLPFGEEYNPQISSNNYRYGGHEHDNESGLDSYGARYYDSTRQVYHAGLGIETTGCLKVIPARTCRQREQ